VSENRVLRKIFGKKGEEVTGEWKKLHNVELRKISRTNKQRTKITELVGHSGKK
jgi:hypothetical protein